jgi:hypothetical protein
MCGLNLSLRRTPEQVKRFEPLISGGYGCFAMTEIGHGRFAAASLWLMLLPTASSCCSFIQGMETTATLDRETDEFVLHSPTITASKWSAPFKGFVLSDAPFLCVPTAGSLARLRLHWTASCLLASSWYVCHACRGVV